MFRITCLLVFPQHRNCLQELYFAENFLEAVGLPSLRSLLCIVLSVILAHQLGNLLIILHLLCFSQGNWDFHILET